MKKRMLIALLLFLLPGLAAGEYWPHDNSHAVACAEGRTACSVLQMAMMGCFDDVQAQDFLDERVFSAVLPQLKAITEEDIAHFCAEFHVEDAEIRRHYYVALANCLLADIHVHPDPGEEETLMRRVLRLFLEPECEEDAQRQMEDIRREMTDELRRHIAEAMKLPEGFVAALIGGSAEQGRMP